MLTCNPNTTWFQGLSNLFCSKDLLPLSSMTLEQQINAITRSMMIIFVIIHISLMLKILRQASNR